MYDQSYMGMRAIVLLRVSTEEQKKMYGFASQLNQIQQKLISPLHLKVNPNHIIEDAYTGLEFRERKALARILELAETLGGDKDPVLLLVDSLDRIGRKGMPREIYRAQLREKGVKILTTDASERSDDDSLMGEMVRLLLGFKAEKELEDIKRRTMNGRRAKAEGNAEKGVPPRHVGHGKRRYGYKWTYSSKNKQNGFELNHDIIKIEEDGTEWTEVKVIQFIFEMVVKGHKLREIRDMLYEKNISAPKSDYWRHTTISRLIRDESYYTGELELFRNRVTKIPGKKQRLIEPRPAEERVKVPIPVIVDKNLAEKAVRILEDNQRLSLRNNKISFDCLLRGGLAKCGYCNRTLVTKNTKQNGKWDVVTYTCSRNADTKHVACLGKSYRISTRILDKAAWEKIIEVAHNPDIFDKRIKDLRTVDPTIDTRKLINDELKKVENQQKALRINLTGLMIQDRPDQGTIEFLNAQLQQLAEQERQWRAELNEDLDIHLKWKEVDEKLIEIHNECKEICAKLDDSKYTISHDEKVMLCRFFGIQAFVYRMDHSPRFLIECNPPSIVSLLS